MKDILKKIKGKKTYIVAFLAANYAAAIGLGLVPSIEIVWGLLGAGGLATVRDGLNHAKVDND